MEQRLCIPGKFENADALVHLGLFSFLLWLFGPIWTEPNVSTFRRRQKTLAVNIPYRGSKEPLQLLIDSKGIKGEGEWLARKYGGPKRRIRRKINLGILATQATG